LHCCAEEIGQRRDGNKKLLELYSEAVRVREAHDLAAALTSSLAQMGLESSSLAAVRVMAGLTDPSLAALHDGIDQLTQSARMNR